MVNATFNQLQLTVRHVSHLRLGYLGLLELHIGSDWALELRSPIVCYYA